MTSDGDALFRAVCEQPWEDTPRLVYADWLEENGRPDRAGLIRFQCEFPKWDASHPRFRELLDRGAGFDPVEAAVEAGLPRPPGVTWTPGWFSRGFPHWVEFRSTRAFAAHADTVFAAAPVDHLGVRRVTRRTAGRILGSPYLARLAWLNLRPDEPVGAALAWCPHLTRLHSLLVWGVFTDACAEALTRSPHLGAVRCLSLSGHSLTDRGAAALADSPELAGVTGLVLHGTRGLGGRTVRRLRERFTRLE